MYSICICSICFLCQSITSLPTVIPIVVKFLHQDSDKVLKIMFLHLSSIKHLLMVRSSAGMTVDVEAALVGDETEGKDCDATVVSHYALWYGAHACIYRVTPVLYGVIPAYTVSTQHGEHLQLPHALIVRPSGYAQHPLVHRVAYPHLLSSSPGKTPGPLAIQVIDREEPGTKGLVIGSPERTLCSEAKHVDMVLDQHDVTNLRENMSRSTGR